MKKLNNINIQSIGKNIGILSRAAHIFFQHQFKDFSIGHAQVMTLHFICKHNGIDQNKISKHSNLDKSSITSQLNILEKNGYIIREKDENDDGVKKIFITEKTKAIKPKLNKEFSAWSKILLDGFNEKEQEKVFDILDKIIENAQNAINELKNNEEDK